MEGEVAGGEKATSANIHLLRGRDVLDLYIHRSKAAESNMAVEREIVVKNFAAFGAVMLLQTGFLVQSFEPELVVFTCGAIILAISAASRAMSIFYSRYSEALWAEAKASKKAALRGKDSLYIQNKERESGLSSLHARSMTLSLRDFFTDTTALGVINAIPGVIGAILMLISILMPIE